MLGSLYAHYRDVRTFGPGSLLRYFISVGTKGPQRLTLPGGQKMSIRPRTTDLDVIRQVFQFGDYNLARHHAHYAAVLARYQSLLAEGKEPIIIDAGANIGAASVYFAQLFPKARILAVEPEPQNAACCRSNCNGIAKINVHEAAIGSVGGSITLSNPAGEAWSPRSSRAENDEGIDIVTIEQLVASIPNGVLFIAKIDIEGFESDLFKHNLDWIEQAQAIIVEIHDWMLPGKRTSKPLQQAMGMRDFELVISGENLIYFNQGN
jgi:FkbM family methyltransferase